MKKTHLTLSERIKLEEYLNKGLSFRQIGIRLNKSHTTISREVKSKLVYVQKGCFGMCFNDCLYRFDCTVSNLCTLESCKHKKCSNCSYCSKFCDDYVKEICEKLSSAPFCCNSCKDRKKCRLEKRFYRAKYAQKEYEDILSEAREGINISEKELEYIDDIVSPLILQGQSIHVIYTNNKDSLMKHEKTIYNYVNKGYLTSGRIQLPRAVKYKKRKGKSKKVKVDKRCRASRTYEDYLKYLTKKPDAIVVQMDTVIGAKGGKTLLTLHFPIPKFMIGILLDRNTALCVKNAFNNLYLSLGKTTFKRLFTVILTDNGSEFSDPSSLEFDSLNKRRTRIFYCNPGASYEKGAIENNHEMIRRILPKSSSFNELNQNDINLMFSHINSYVRKDLGDKTPYEIFKNIYGEKALKKMGINLIPANKVILNPSLLK